MDKCQHQQIKIMPDYKSSGIWCLKCGSMIEVESIGLSKEIANRLKKWIEEFDSFLDWNNPGNSPSYPKEKFDAHDKEGQILTNLVKNELGDKYEVFWWKDIRR